MLRPTHWLVTLAAGVALACGEPAPKGAAEQAAEMPAAEPWPADVPPTAKLDVARMLEEDRDAKRSPADGGGHARLVPHAGRSGPGEGRSGTLRARLRGGPARNRERRRDLPAGVALLGLEHAAGRARRMRPATPTLEASAERRRAGRARRSTRSCSAIRVAGRPLVAGRARAHRLRRGPGRRNHRPLRRARLALLVRRRRRRRRRTRGSRRLARCVDVLPRRPPARSLVTLPSDGAPGRARDASRSRCSMRQGNAGTDFDGRGRASGAAAGARAPATRRALAPPIAGAGRSFAIAARARGRSGCAPRARRPRGREQPASGRRATDRACCGPTCTATRSSRTAPARRTTTSATPATSPALDVAALTDHDHWGMLPLDAHPELWEEIQRQTPRFHEPGRFVTLLGYEWTSWIHGHRHVLYFDDDGRGAQLARPALRAPAQLWARSRASRR